MWPHWHVTDRWPEAVVFDLDGTLIDSVGDITDALNVALRQADLEPFSEAEVRLMVGGGSRALIDRALSARGRADDAGLAERLYNAFLEIYLTASVARTTIYDHGRTMLDELRQSSMKLAICTNKPADITESILSKLGLRTSFDAVVGGTDELPKKPHPAMLLAALSALDVAPDRAIMIGDSSADVDAARAAGLPVIAVSFGYSRISARELGADFVVDSLAEIAGAIQALKKRRC